MGNLPLFIESICIKNQEIQLLDYHNRRANESRYAAYNSMDVIDLGEIIDTNNANTPIVKCRIVYGEKIKSVEYLEYTLRPINNLRIIDIEKKWHYKHKYLDRSSLDHYFSQRGKADDMIMIQDGYVTDSYYGNLAFLKNGTWFTPETPLLRGTKRASLIDQNIIVEQQIKVDDIKTYEAVRLFNAMIDFGRVEISVDKID